MTNAPKWMDETKVDQFTESTAFTFEEFNRLKQRYRDDPPVAVGIVCKPRLEMAIRRMIQSSRISAGLNKSIGQSFALPLFTDPYQFALPLFTDPYQSADSLVFYSWAMLKAYLNRRSDYAVWARCCMRDLLSKSKDHRAARRYAIPFNLPPIVEVDESRLLAKAREMDKRG